MSISQVSNWDACYRSFKGMTGKLQYIIDLVEEMIDLGEKLQKIDVLFLFY